jgi:hypothetical protein
MLASLTFNMNRKEETQPISHTAFLRFPSVESWKIKDMSEIALVITASIIPPTRLIPIWEGERENIIASYYWESDQWMYS